MQGILQLNKPKKEKWRSLSTLQQVIAWGDF